MATELKPNATLEVKADRIELVERTLLKEFMRADVGYDPNILEDTVKLTPKGWDYNAAKAVEEAQLVADKTGARVYIETLAFRPKR